MVKPKLQKQTLRVKQLLHIKWKSAFLHMAWGVNKLEKKMLLSKLSLGLDIFWFAGVVAGLLLLCSEFIIHVLPQGQSGILFYEPNFFILWSEVVAFTLVLLLTPFQILGWLRRKRRNA